MFDPLLMISIITYINIRDYFDDRERAKREMMHEYKLCFDGIGDNSEMIGNTILSAYSQSNYTELEEIIVKGAKQLPLYIFLRILSVQGKVISKHQLKIINLYLSNFSGIGITREECMKALSGNGSAMKILNESVGLSENHCGEFWKAFIKVMYETEMEEDAFSRLISSYAEIVYRFALLGDCSSKRAETVYQNFVRGFQKYLKEGAVSSIDMTDFADEVRFHYSRMKQICKDLRNAGDEEDDILLDIFDYFCISMVTGMLKYARLNEGICIELLQNILDVLLPDYRYTAEQIYEGFKVSEDAKLNFYGLANDWDNVNFWKILFIQSTKNSMENVAIEFISETSKYVEAVEKLFIQRFQPGNMKGVSHMYMRNMNENIGRFLESRI